MALGGKAIGDEAVCQFFCRWVGSMGESETETKVSSAKRARQGSEQSHWRGGLCVTCVSI